MRKTSLIALVIVLFATMWGIGSVYGGGSNVEISNQVTTTKPIAIAENTLKISNAIQQNQNQEESTKQIRDLSEFLTDVLALQTAILVLLIPLSFDVVSRISDRYRSDVIIKRFQDERVLIGLVVVLVINIFYVVFLRYFSVESKEFNFVALLLTVISVGLLIAFIRLIILYTSGTRYIKEKLLNDAKNLLR